LGKLVQGEGKATRGFYPKPCSLTVLLFPPCLHLPTPANSSIAPSSKSHQQMPSEHIYPTINEQSQQDHTQAQVKLCLICHGTLTVESANATFFDPNDATNVCTSCRDQLLSERLGLGETYGHPDLIESDVVSQVHPMQDTILSSRILTHIHDERPLAVDINMLVEPSSPDTQSLIAPDVMTSSHRLPSSQTSSTNKHTIPRTTCNTNVPSTSIFQSQSRAMSTTGTSSTHFRSKSFATSSPDPLVDITRIRVRSQGHHCLYPGASFQGTQKSGRNSYDVNVTIVVRYYFTTCLILHDG
jgi:hypothetical protein